MGSIKRGRSIRNYKVERIDRSWSLCKTKKNAEHILIDLVYFTRSANVDFIHIDRTRIVDRLICGSIYMNHGRNNVKFLWKSSEQSMEYRRRREKKITTFFSFFSVFLNRFFQNMKVNIPKYFVSIFLGTDFLSVEYN